MTAAEATRLATEVRNSYITRRREVEDVAKALDILAAILTWAETSPNLGAYNPDMLEIAQACRERVQQIANT